MTERRSTRSKRQVDYSALCNDDDNDFTTTPTPPVAKKATKSKADKENTVTKQESVPKENREIRVPVDDRLQEKDLELALELSLQSSVECCISPIKPERIPPKSSPVSSTPPLSDEDSSSEFNESESDDSNDSYNEEDSDFDDHISKSKKNAKPKTKSVTPAARSKPAIKEKICKTTTAVVEKQRKNVAISRKSTSAVTSPCPSRVAVSQKQAWVAPSPAGNSISKSPLVAIKSKSPSPWGGNGRSPLGGVSLKSPISGLRLGLSRNQNVRPLHPNVKTQQ